MRYLYDYWFLVIMGGFASCQTTKQFGYKHKKLPLEMLSDVVGYIPGNEREGNLLQAMDRKEVERFIEAQVRQVQNRHNSDQNAYIVDDSWDFEHKKDYIAFYAITHVCYRISSWILNNNEIFALLAIPTLRSLTLGYEADIFRLDCSWCDIKDLSLLNKLSEQIKNTLRELNLSCNQIDISTLANFNLAGVRVLDLSSNQISDISILANTNLAELSVLDLSNNRISDISALASSNLMKLTKLDLSNNRISDISALANSNLMKLKKLDLSTNRISDISILASFQLANLQKLDLSSNRIYDASVLSELPMSWEIPLFNNPIWGWDKLSKRWDSQLNVNLPMLRCISLLKWPEYDTTDYD